MNKLNTKQYTSFTGIYPVKTISLTLLDIYNGHTTPLQVSTFGFLFQFYIRDLSRDPFKSSIKRFTDIYLTHGTLYLSYNWIFIKTFYVSDGCVKPYIMLIFALYIIIQ